MSRDNSHAADSKKNAERWERVQNIISKMAEDGHTVIAMCYDSKKKSIEFAGPEFMFGFAHRVADDFIGTAIGHTQKSVVPAGIGQLDIRNSNAHNIRKVTSDIVSTDVFKRTGIKRGFYGLRNLAPVWYPLDVEFVSPNDNKSGKRLSREDCCKVVETYKQYVLNGSRLIPVTDAENIQDSRNIRITNVTQQPSILDDQDMEAQQPVTVEEIPKEAQQPVTVEEIPEETKQPVTVEEIPEAPSSKGKRPTKQMTSKEHQRDNVRWKFEKCLIKGNNGLANFNSNCWLNASLQALKVIDIPHLEPSDLGDNRCLWLLVQLLQRLKDTNTDKKCYPVDEILDLLDNDAGYPDCRKGVQQDPSNFIATFLGQLGMIGFFWPLEVRYNRSCQNCTMDRNGLVQPQPILMVDTQAYLPVQQSVDEYFREEVLAGKERVYCNNCQTKAIHVQKARIEREPSILLIQMKRYNPNTLQKELVPVIASRDIVLPLQKTHWVLKAIIVHTGTVASSGHYVTYTLHDHSHVLCYDDAIVTSKRIDILDSRFIAMNGYIYVYQKANLKISAP